MFNSTFSAQAARIADTMDTGSDVHRLSPEPLVYKAALEFESWK
jgi:hypothetical protein